MCSCKVDPNLIPNKLFYFFYYAGVSCVSPFLPHFLQERGLLPVDITLILGTVPFLVVLTKPALGHLADRSGHLKPILLTALIFGIVCMTTLIFLPAIPGTYSHWRLYSCDVFDRESTVDLLNDVCQAVAGDRCSMKCVMDYSTIEKFTSTSTDDNATQLCSNGTVEIGSLNNYCGPKSNNFICYFNCKSPALPKTYSNQTAISLFETVHVKYWQFWLFLLAIVCGTDLGLSPSCTLVDSHTLDYLKRGGRREDFGKQRMWMSVGMGISMITVGFLMDVLSGDDPQKTNYWPAFIGLLICIFLAIISAMLLKSSPQIIQSERIIDGEAKAICINQSSAVAINNHCNSKKPSIASLGLWRIVGILMSRSHSVVFCIVTFVIGMNYGNAIWLGVWFLKQLGASQLAIGVTAVVTSATSAFWFFVSGRILRVFGHFWTALMVLIAYALRSLLWSFLVRPWHALLMEVCLGFAIGMWIANMGAFASSVATKGCHASAQAVLSAIYDGLGVGVGNLVSGWLVQIYGPRVTWRLFSGGTAGVGLAYALFLIAGKCLNSSLFKSDKANSNSTNDIQKELTALQSGDCESNDNKIC